MSKVMQEEAFPEGVNLLFAILTRYPEIGYLELGAEERVLHMTFFVQETLEEERARALGELLFESATAYHLLEGYVYDAMEFEYSFHEGVTFLTIVRDLNSLSRGEISVLVEVLKDQVGAALVVDYQAELPPGTEEFPGDEEYLDGLFQSIRRLPPQTLIGIREEGRVLVYTQ
ncbi:MULTISPECIES: hypothetical protein [Sporomusaceae]|uniref:hypothetical protein n=1 Tax=Sporomusaceae TaxID=1843490 RepID=UPI00036CE3EF|nr:MULTISPECIES: hypothetical protein [Sporomusaceae]